MDEDGDRKLGLAFMLACPACAGGFFLAIGAAFGATALALKGFALAALLTLVLGLWARNYWRRRNEEACDLPRPERNLGTTKGEVHSPEVRSTPTK